MIRIVKTGDGFTPLPVTADGDLGVGAPQYRSCQGCQSFGCAVSAMPGSYGEVTRSLCFDAACNSQKVALWRKAQRDARAAVAEAAGKDAAKAGKARRAGAMPTTAAAPTNVTPQRVMTHRLAEWRKWLAKALMVQPQRSQRVLIALAGRGGDLREAEFRKAYERIAGKSEGVEFGLRGGLRRADAAPESQLDRLVQVAIACAAFGVDTGKLGLLLNYAEVDERCYFRWNKEFLDLLTMSELECLAAEVGLKKTMGSGFKAARSSKKQEFIAALLNVPGFAYEGTVPAVMRYPRQTVLADGRQDDKAADTGAEDADATDTAAQETEPTLD